MRKSNHSYTDETGAKVNGERYNTWVFNNENTTLLVTRKSRGKNVIEEVLGKNYKGVIGRIGDAVNGEYTLGTVDNRGEDIPVPGTAGYYTVGVDMANNKLLVEPANVYVCGDAVGAWPVSSVVEANKFKLDTENKTMYLTKTYSAAELRLHVTHPYIGEWWHAEFIFLDGKIEYREDGNDQARFSIDAGERTIELDFINQTGKIK